MKRSVQISLIDVNEKTLRRLETQLNDILAVEPQARIELFPMLSAFDGLSTPRPQLITFVRRTTSETMEVDRFDISGKDVPIEEPLPEAPPAVN